MASKTSTSGIGFFGLLTIVFITLKLLKVITWSWWWVLSAFWMPFALMFIGFIGIAVATAIKGGQRDGG